MHIIDSVRGSKVYEVFWNINFHAVILIFNLKNFYKTPLKNQ